MELRKIVKHELFALMWILLLGFGFYMYVLTRHSLIYGVDGPYYLIQVRSLLESGHLAYEDPPLAFFLFTFFTLFFGGNATLGVRVGTALFSALSAAPLYFWMKKITRFRTSGYVAMLACIFSSPHVWLLNDFLKNAVGAFFLLCFLYFLHCMVVEKGGRDVLFKAIVFLVLTGATHVLDFGVAMFFLLLYPAFALVIGVNRKEMAKNVEILVFTALFFAMLAPVAFPFFFSDFYKVLALVFTVFSGDRTPQIPLLFNPPTRFLLDPIGGVFVLPALAVGAVLSVYEWKLERKEATLALAAVTLVGITLSLPLIPPDWLWRFLLMEFVPVAFVIGYGFSKIPRNVAISTVVFFLCFTPMILQAVAVSSVLRPTISEVDYHEIESMRKYLPSNSVVIVANPFVRYWVEYITQSNVASNFSPELWREYEHVILVIDKFLGMLPIHPSMSEILRGRRFILYEIMPLNKRS